MRTPEERTSGAWTGGCDLTTDGGNEKNRTAGDWQYGNPKNTQGAGQTGSFIALENLSQTTGPKKPRGQNEGSGSEKRGEER